MGAKDQTTSESSPWAGQQPFLKDIFGEGQRLYQTPLQYGPGRVNQAFSAQTLEGEQAGLGLIRGAGQGAGYDYLNQSLRGDFLDPSSNPYLAQMGQTVADRTSEAYQRTISPQISQGAYGRAGSGMEANLRGQAQQGLAQELYRGQADLFGGFYNQERGRQQQSAAFVPQYGANQRADIATGYQLGQRPDQLQQSLLDDLTSRYQFGQQEPWQRLQRYNQAITGSAGVIPGTTTSTTQRGFGAVDALGLGFSALGAGAMGAGALGWSPFGP